MFSVPRAADITGGKNMHSSVFDRRESTLLVKQPLFVGPPLRAFELFGALAAYVVMNRAPTDLGLNRCG